MFKFRVRVLSGLLLAGFLVVLGRLAQLQILRGASYREMAARSQSQERLLPGLRGPILSRDGEILARDLPSFDLAVRVEALPPLMVRLEDVKRAREECAEGEARRAAFAGLRGRLMTEPWVRRLAARFERPEEEVAAGVLDALDQVARKWARASAPLPILRGVDEPTWTALRAQTEDQFLNPPPSKRKGTAVALTPSFLPPGDADAASEPPFPGLVCTHSVRREYLHGAFLAHVLGTLCEIAPEQMQQLRQDGVLTERLVARTRLWAVFRMGLDEPRAAALHALLGADPREMEDLNELLARLRGLKPGEGRARAAQFGLADFVRWAERPPRMELCEAEKLYVGCGASRLLADGRVGETGVECWYNEWLRGKHGLDLPVGFADAEAGDGALHPPDARPREGRALALTISCAWQAACEKALASLNHPAAVVVLDCETGDVLALASFPNFDPGLFSPPREGHERLERLKSLLADPAKPLLNRAIAERYPLGSVMKPLVAAAALEKGLLQPEDRNCCPGYLQEGPTRYHCDAKRAHGDVDLIEALRRSCNVYFYKVGARIGVEGLAPFACAVGFGRRTGIDLPGEVAGVYPDRAWRAKTFPRSIWDLRWSRGKDYHLAIGQGYLNVTPLQTACMMATLANGGYPVTPRLWLEAPAAPPRAAVFSARTLAIVRQGLDEACNFGTPGARGTAYSAFHNSGELAVRVAGKTGTADVAKEDAKPHAWFAGFAPADAPKVAFCVFVENGGHGGEVAAPVAYRILREVYGTRGRRQSAQPGPVASEHPGSGLGVPGSELAHGPGNTEH